MGPLFGWPVLFGKPPYVRQPGPGVARAAERLAAHRAQWDGVDMTPKMTRQRDRAYIRAAEKRERAARKREAMRDQHKGGAAAVR